MFVRGIQLFRAANTWLFLPSFAASSLFLPDASCCNNLLADCEVPPALLCKWWDAPSPSLCLSKQGLSLAHKTQQGGGTKSQRKCSTYSSVCAAARAPRPARAGNCWILEEACGGEGRDLEACARPSELELQKCSQAMVAMGTRHPVWQRPQMRSWPLCSLTAAF